MEIRINDILKHPLESLKPAVTNLFINDPNKPDLIELRNIHQRYTSPPSVIFEDLNLLIEHDGISGRFISLLGKSGCGKSTILKYIAGLQTPTSGEILINGKVVSGHQIVAMMFQDYSSLPWKTVYKNISLGLEYQGKKEKEIREIVEPLINEVGLKGHENKYCTKEKLSGGQLQRVALARTLAISPKILLLDEPLGALDVMNRLNLQDLLRSLWQKYNMTIVSVTHDINEAIFLSDEIWVLKNKKIGDRFIPNLPLERPREIRKSVEFLECAQELTQLVLEDS